MTYLQTATPRISVKLFKTISRKTIDGQAAVSARYEGKSPDIDLTPFLGDGSSVTTTKSVRDAAGGFVITFADRPHQSVVSSGIAPPVVSDLESIYGLVEPMDMIEIRMWGGVGQSPAILPIRMRGFVSDVSRSEAVSESGIPVRSVSISGQDYGKIWQMYQVLYMQAYSAGYPLLTTYNMWEMFGIEAKNTLPASKFVTLMIEKVINPFIAGFLPENSPMPRDIKTKDSVIVKHGVINNSYQSQQGSVYDIMKFQGDVGVWNELYTEDREDGVYCVYRPTPAMHVTKPDGDGSSLIQDDAKTPIFIEISGSDIVSISLSRSDSNVANFYWVNNERYDLIDDNFRRLFALTSGDKTVDLKDYPNVDPKYYGVRQMYADTQQSEESIDNATSGLKKAPQEARQKKIEDWITNRRRLMVEMNKDNVVLERGTIKIKGGMTRPGGKELMKAGDYARIKRGNIEFIAYIVSVSDEFVPYNGYLTTLIIERCTGFVKRASSNGAPWLIEQASI